MVAAMRTMLEESVREGLIPANPVRSLGKFYRSAKRIKDKIDPFTIEELHLSEAKCREKFPEYYSLILCLSRTGMRIGEVFAMQWWDLEFNKGCILVRRNIPPHRHVETPKTAASERKVDLSPELAAELKQLQVERKKQALADGRAFDMEQWMFPNDEGTPIFYTNFLRRIWYKVQDAAKIRRRTPHEAQLGKSHARGGSGFSLCLLAAWSRKSCDYPEDLCALGAGDEAGYDVDSGHKTGKWAADQFLSVIRCTSQGN
jgi:integrase